MSNTLLPNFPTVANSSGCGCASGTPIDFGDIFSEDALYKLDKTDSLCDAYTKINANFKMLSDGFLALAQAINHQQDVPFLATTPTSYQGSFSYNTSDQRLYVWNGSTACYVPSYGCNSVTNGMDKLADPFMPASDIPAFSDLRNLCDSGTASFSNDRGLMKITFTSSDPACAVSLFIWNKAKKKFGVWSPLDGKYVYDGDLAITSGVVYDAFMRE
jgi:hypothetical protein